MIFPGDPARKCGLPNERTGSTIFIHDFISNLPGHKMTRQGEMQRRTRFLNMGRCMPRSIACWIVFVIT